MAEATDPVTAVLDAHRAGRPIALRTSGTSGTPRSVVRTTASWFDSFPHVTRLFGLGAGSSVFVPGPLSSTMNLFASVHAAVVGARTQATPWGATHAVVTPATLAGLTTDGGTTLEGMHVLVAGDSLSAALHDRAVAAGARQVSHYYGAAELSFVAWGPHAGALSPFPGVEVESADGLLWVRSPYLSDGYAGAAGPLQVRPDGFATVGDRGRVTEGRVVVMGRGTDAVVTAGATVLVADVERALTDATGHDVAVAALPHPDLGAVLCAVTTTESGLSPLRRAAREVLEPSHRPRRWFVTEDLPLTRAGKLDREALGGLVHRLAGRKVHDGAVAP